MQIKEVKEYSYFSLRDDSPLREVGKMFVEKSIPYIAILDPSEKPVGVVGQNQFIHLCMNNSLDTEIGKVVTLNWKSMISKEEELSKGLVIPTDYALVIDSVGRFYGLVLKRDLIWHFMQSSHSLFQGIHFVLDFFHNGILVVDTKGQITFANHQCKVMMERADAGELLGEVLDPLSELGEKVYGVLEDHKKIVGEDLVINGKTVYSSFLPLMDKDYCIGVFCSLQSSREVRAILRELNQAKELNTELSILINSSYDGIVVTDGQGKVLRINKAHQRVTGIAPEEMLGKNMQDVVKEGLTDKSVTLMVLEQRKPVTISAHMKNGKEIIITGNPIFNEKGEIVRVLTNLRDISELNMLQKSLEATQEEKKKFQTELQHLREQQLHYDRIVADSPQMQQVIELVLQVADKDSTIMIQGESGVGKEIVAKIIHRISKRKDGPYIKINCGAIPENLLESELFGYEEGAFTGAKRGGKIGLIEMANGGTLFLDEIGELSLSLQVKLLRFLQEREITRVGGTTPIPINTRLICATNRDLKKMVEEGSFGEDLFYRLFVVPILIPPLRERKKDIKPLIQHFLDKFNSKYNMNKEIGPEVMEKLIEYSWPGNVRELENVIERLVVSTRGRVIGDVDLQTTNLAAPNNKGDFRVEVSEIIPLKDAVEMTEKKLLIEALEKYKVMGEAAEALGVDRTTVLRKLRKYGIPYPLLGE
jgi:PAS domain S-box-containing protein